VASSPKSSPVTGANLLRKRFGRFQVAVTFRHATRAKILLRLAARHSLGSVGDGARVLLWRRFPVDRLRHQVFDADPVLRGLGLQRVDPLWRPGLPEVWREEGGRVLDDHGVDPHRSIVGLVPSGAWGPSKQWPAGRFGDLARCLEERGIQAVVLVGPGEEDLGDAVQSVGFPEIPVVGQNLDVAGLTGVVAHLAAMACNDSGPMHLASLAGVPAVAVFGPTDPVRTAPLGARHTVLSLGLECSPCFERRCPLVHQHCLQRLPVSMVAATVEKMIDLGAASRPMVEAHEVGLPRVGALPLIPA